MATDIAKECDSKPCNMVLGHPGPHGFMIDGLILAPRPNTGGLLEERIVDLPCDCCGRPMTMHKREDGGEFTCTCEQSHGFTETGHSQTKVTIFPTMHVFLMHDDLRERFIRHHRKTVMFVAQARKLLGLPTPESPLAQLDVEIEAMESKRQEWLRAHPKWWQFWKAKPKPENYPWA